jgi:gliding motility-associated-like protein
MKHFLLHIGLCVCVLSQVRAQTQQCPANINFSAGALTHWLAYTGNNMFGNGPSAIKLVYDSTDSAPSGTIGASTIQEYQLPTVNAITVNVKAGIDYFGGFLTVPTINGYQYSYSVLLGSTAITRNLGNGARGGYIRGISYKINVPPGPATEPYTMTYAYAMVLENGMHNSNQQPLFSAILITADSVIRCASPSYFLPTENNADTRGGGATLDSAVAIAEGFKVSNQRSPNSDPNSAAANAPHLQDVWTKGWTEVTFDLSPYRGTQVTLTFEADNCVPGGHFAYAYVAIRNNCAGLMISGDPLACINSNLTYSVPALTGASYQWSVPSNWTVTSSLDTNVIHVNVGNTGGLMVVHEANSCANLIDSLTITTTPPTIPGSVSGNATACADSNVNMLKLSGNQGNVLSWIYSTDGINWNDASDTSALYTASNLKNTTTFRALVQNSPACSLDTSTGATIVVDQVSVGGNLSPGNSNFCIGQSTGALLALSGNTGAVLNWQSSLDSINWNNFNPAYNDSLYEVTGVVASTQFRTIVKNGVCPSDTSGVASIHFFNTPFPQAGYQPADTIICYGDTAQLYANISVGTSYSWTNYDSLANAGDGVINSMPYPIHASASPKTSTDYVLTVQNAGCPNSLSDTFQVKVLAPIVVNAGNDTSVVVGQPLQLLASSSEQGDSFLWSPSLGLNNPDIPNPVAILDAEPDTVRYLVKASSVVGCFGEASILVKVFKTAPDIFVPNAFTPGLSINRIFRPIPVGVASMQYFKIYNRWGQLIYSTSRMGEGWDGTVNGKPQDTDSYVWMVRGTDYTGKTIFKKGTMTLIR